MCRKSIYLTLFAVAIVATSAHAAVVPITDITINRVYRCCRSAHHWRIYRGGYSTTGPV
ncbi:MAG: hypothetical protein ACYTFW_08685 [Planctomycetota bacterium]